MPKAVEIADFAHKLDLVCKRLNWSRARLAQQAGVDKSLASRWMSGVARPTGNSLMMLNDAIGKALPSFSPADWDRSPTELVVQWGLPALATSQRSMEALPPLAQAIAELSTISGVQSRTLDRDTETYAGFYWVYFFAPSGEGVIGRRAFEIFRRGETLRMRSYGLHTAVDGVVYVWGRCLYMISEQARLDMPVFMVWNGTIQLRPELLSGLALSRAPTNSESVMAMRGVLEFQHRPFVDPDEHQRHWQAMVDAPLTFEPAQAAKAGISEKIIASLTSQAGSDGLVDATRLQT